MNQKGFAPILIMILIAVVVGGYFIYTNYSQYRTKPTVPSPTPSASPPASSDASPAPTVTDETANWKTYIERSGGFSLRYPPDWKVLPGANNNLEPALIISSPVATPTQETGPTDADSKYYLTLSYKTESKTPKQVIDERVKKEQSYQPSFKLTERKSIKIDGIDGEWAVEFPSPSPAVDIYINHNNKLYHILFYPYVPSTNKHMHIFNQILSTFKFTQ